MKSITPESALLISRDYMGDALMYSPALRCMKEHGVKRLDVMCREECKPVFRANKYVDGIYGYTRNWEIFWQALTGRSVKYDLCLHFGTSLYTGFLLWLFGGKIRLGFNHRGRGIFNTIKVYSPQKCATKGYRVRECLDLLEKGLGWKCENEEMIWK